MRRSRGGTPPARPDPLPVSLPAPLPPAVGRFRDPTTSWDSRLGYSWRAPMIGDRCIPAAPSPRSLPPVMVRPPVANARGAAVLSGRARRKARSSRGGATSLGIRGRAGTSRLKGSAAASVAGVGRTRIGREPSAGNTSLAPSSRNSGTAGAAVAVGWKRENSTWVISSGTDARCWMRSRRWNCSIGQVRTSGTRARNAAPISPPATRSAPSVRYHSGWYGRRP